ncbi:YxiJ family protein [Paenibacillus sp. N3.4]|uniref:YxiJ family protein n=1 Tax=Paenibacillus sp. N3.4 TaxID=2603222 RepID=UPI0011C8715D|nr:hypothetical protein FU659_30200 [Paenibacillus sp. N3.4]
MRKLNGYEDLRNLQRDFALEFKKNAPHEIITADLNTYLMFISGLASGGLQSQLEDALERFNMKKWLEKSFYDWFPKYRFLETWDLTHYSALNADLTFFNQARSMMLEVIREVESNRTRN